MDMPQESWVAPKKPQFMDQFLPITRQPTVWYHYKCWEKDFSKPSIIEVSIWYVERYLIQRYCFYWFVKESHLIEGMPDYNTKIWT